MFGAGLLYQTCLQVLGGVLGILLNDGKNRATRAGLLLKLHYIVRRSFNTVCLRSNEYSPIRMEGCLSRRA